MARDTWLRATRPPDLRLPAPVHCLIASSARLEAVAACPQSKRLHRQGAALFSRPVQMSALSPERQMLHSVAKSAISMPSNAVG